MHDRDAFFAAIVSRPDDDLPRLIYADYLDERGDAERAEFIRLQCAAARGEPDVDLRRIAQLDAAHHERWLAECGPSVYYAAFRRGFAEHVVMSARDFLRDGPELRSRSPIRSMALLGAGQVLARLLAEPHLAGLTALHLTGSMLGDHGVERLTECEHLSSLTTLRLARNEVSDSGVSALAAAVHLEQLRVLSLNGNSIGDSGVWELARTPCLNQLTTLDLSGNEISVTGVAMLSNSPWLPELTELHAGDQRPSPSRWRLPALLAKS